MAKKTEDEEGNQPKAFDPSQPLEDADDEEEVQRRHRMTQRLDHLKSEAEKNGKSKSKDGKKRSMVW